VAIVTDEALPLAIGFAPNDAVAPDGSAPALSATLWAPPEVIAVLIARLLELPAVMLTLEGETLIEKSGGAETFTATSTV
jgi:hypothetical protein